MFKTGQGDDGS